jgi:hypothetical protein
MDETRNALKIQFGDATSFNSINHTIIEMRNNSRFAEQPNQRIKHMGTYIQKYSSTATLSLKTFNCSHRPVVLAPLSIGE